MPPPAPTTTTGNYPAYPAHQQVPAATGSQPQMHPSNVPSHVPNPAPSTPAMHDGRHLQRPNTGPVPIAPQSQRFTTNPGVAPRITVQYPQDGAVLTSTRGNYVVQNVIGSGEFGAVYECVGPFDQLYAIKMIRPANRPYGEVHAEWAREVQRLMSLRHPNVVYIFDAFEQNHLFYLALERCDHPLTAMLGTPMQEGLVLELARQLLAAAQFLHENDIVHDDLHPGNVLITHGDRPIVKISDFGISQALRGAPAIRPNVVHHKIMAPEVAASGYTTKQSDLYQVGLLLFWMLTGVPAIPLGIPYQELVRQVTEGEPRRRAEEIGTPLGQLVAKMLRRRETYRYTSAREIWADLRELPAWQNRNLFRGK